MGVTVIDAGVLIAGFDLDDAHAIPASRMLREAGARGDALLVPASAYSELLVRPARHGTSTVARFDVALNDMGMTIVPVDRGIARGAAALRGRHTSLRLPDALVIATAIDLDVDHLLTTDRRWRHLRIPSLRGRLLIVGDGS